MPEILPRLRYSLEFSPSPAPDRPGLLVRDPFHYSDAVLIVPPALAQCLALFDGTSTDLDLRQALVQLTDDLRVGDIQRNLVETLSSSGFLEDDVFRRMRAERHRQFSEAPARTALLAGGGYPADTAGLRSLLDGYLNNGAFTAPGPGNLCGIAAPHVSLEGGWKSYQAAYGTLRPDLAGRTFVVLGTSHYGEPDRFGLTRKPFVTPLGETSVDLGLVDRLAEAGGAAVKMEDYCHSIEHSIEFQVIFLQHVFSPSVRIVPILCGPLARGLERGTPLATETVSRFVEALGEMAERERPRLFWVLGIDMAHMGRRYHDSFPVRAGEGHMLEVAARDRARIDCALAGDADGFWELMGDSQDDLKWCGTSPLYTFLKAVPKVRGELLHYEQWNIDPQSVVTFGGLAFKS